MRILAHFNNRYSGRKTEEIVYDGVIDDAKKDLYYVEINGEYYEWITYDTGYSGYDYVAHYGQISSVGSHVSVYKLNERKEIKCTCGSASVNHPGHAYHCRLLDGQRKS